MTDEQLDATLALMQRQQAGWASAETERRDGIELIEMEEDPGWQARSPYSQAP
jgi:hypothetical protein